MSTNENTPVESPDVDLDTFAAELFGQKEAAPEKTNSEAESDTEAESDAQEEDTQTDETDTLDTDSDDDETDEAEDQQDEEGNSSADSDEDKPQPKKKTRFQERIDELTAKAREAERREQAALERIEALEKSTKKEEKTETPVQESAGPSANDKNADGSDKYPLGEFDPRFIQDLARFTIQQERELSKVEEAKERQQREEEAVRQTLEKEWQTKLGSAQERYPDFQQKSENLVDTFQGIEPAYGEYLGATIMSMDYGPDVLYYLANHPDEATKIVQSGPTKATILLGRLESKFADAQEEKQQVRPKTSKAPPPPKTQLKGSTAVMDIPDDTDDLEAFERKLFQRK